MTRRDKTKHMQIHQHVSSELDHHELGFAHSTLWTCPVGGNVIPRRAGCYAILRDTLGFVISKAANDALPNLHHVDLVNCRGLDVPFMYLRLRGNRRDD